MVHSFTHPVCNWLSSPEIRGETPFTAEDWRALEKYVLTHGLAPLLYWRFRQVGWPKEMPEEMRSSLSQAYYANFARNTLLFSELGRLLLAYAQADIPVVVLKGAALAPKVYANIALRPMGDLDLLVPRLLFPTAMKVAAALDYQEVRQQVALGLESLADYHVHLYSKTHKVDLELHWNLVASEDSWYAAPVGWFWENTKPYPFEEAGLVSPGWRENSLAAETYIFTPTAMLLHLAGHAMIQHGRGHTLLIWLYDIHALLEEQAGEIEWDLLLEQAKDWGWSQAVRAALVEVQDCFGTVLPAGILEALEAGGGKRTASLVNLKGRFPRARLLGDWYTLLSLHWPARLRYVWAMIFPRREYIYWRYRPRPVWTWPLYYPYRWARAAWDALATLVRLIWRET